MKTMKRILAGVSAIAMIAMNAVYYVPSVSAANQTVTNSGSTTTSLSVTFGTNFTTSQVVTISLKLLDGTNTGIDISSIAADVAVGGATVASVGVNNADSITVTTAGAGVTDGTIVISNAVLPNNSRYVVSVATTSDHGVGQFNIGTPTSNIVNVSATVVPTLSMTLTNATISLGTLTQGTVATSATTSTLAVATNAANGYTVSVTSANGSLAGTATPITSASADLAVAAKGYGIQASVGAGTPTVAAPYNGAAQNVGQLQISAQTLFSKASLSTTDSVTVTYKAKVDNTIVAGNYSDTLTYTISGNF